jgi:hypothetical protein
MLSTAHDSALTFSMPTRSAPSETGRMILTLAGYVMMLQGVCFAAVLAIMLILHPSALVGSDASAIFGVAGVLLALSWVGSRLLRVASRD